MLRTALPTSFLRYEVVALLRNPSREPGYVAKVLCYMRCTVPDCLYM
jgi:hypothetical protein